VADWIDGEVTDASVACAAHPIRAAKIVAPRDIRLNAAKLR
jgi:hypothetical protein